MRLTPFPIRLLISYFAVICGSISMLILFQTTVKMNFVLNVRAHTFVKFLMCC